MRAIVVTILAVSLALLAGCSGEEEKLVGTWKLSSYQNTKKADEKPADCDLELRFKFLDEASDRKVGGAAGKKLIIEKGKTPCKLGVCMGEPYETAWAVKGGKLQVGTMCFSMNSFSGTVEIVEVTDKKLELNFADRLKMTFEKAK